MQKSKLTMVLALGLAVLLIGLNGCAGKKKPSDETKQEIKAPEKKPAPRPQIQEPSGRVQEELTPPRDLKFSTIYFDFDKSNIRQDQSYTLNSNAALLEKYNTVKLLIEGHCDERGTDEYNLALGDRRANSAKRYLVDYGIASSRITIVSYGESRPVDRGHNEGVWQKNRRCEFIIISE